MTVSELIDHLKQFDGTLPVYAPNWHEEYGEVTFHSVKRHSDYVISPMAHTQIEMVAIVGSL